MIVFMLHARVKKSPVYWLVVAGRFVPMLLVIAGALVISTVGLLFIMSLVDGGSPDTELVEFD